MTEQPATAVRHAHTTRTGKAVATVEVTFPDGTTGTTTGKRAAQAAAVIIGEVHIEKAHQIETSPGWFEYEPAGSHWEWRYLSVRSNVHAAQALAAKYAQSDHFRNVATVIVTDA